AADRPMTFLDHHLQTGDSLIGTWVSCLRRAPASARSRGSSPSLPLGDERAIGAALRGALPIRFSLAADPNDTAAQVREKERALAALARRDSALSKWKRIADLWCARWFATDPPPAAAFA